MIDGLIKRRSNHAGRNMGNHPGDLKLNNLTLKQERFAQLYVELGNASEAYRQAYNSKAKMESVNVNASKLVADAKVSLRINELRGETIKRHNVTVDSLIAELEEARNMALETAQTSAAVSATMGKAKLVGLDKQVIDHTSSDGTMSPKSVTKDVADALSRKLLGED